MNTSSCKEPMKSGIEEVHQYLITKFAFTEGEASTSICSHASFLKARLADNIPPNVIAQMVANIVFMGRKGRIHTRWRKIEISSKCRSLDQDCMLEVKRIGDVFLKSCSGIGVALSSALFYQHTAGELILYFSPAAGELALNEGAVECDKPDPGTITLLVGSGYALPLLFK